MTTRVSEQGGIKIVHVGDELGREPDAFVDTVTEHLSGPGARVVLDMSGVQFLNSSGLSELVRVVAQANVQEGRVVMANITPFVEGVLQTTQLDRFFTIRPTTADAIAALS